MSDQEGLLTLDLGGGEAGGGHDGGETVPGDVAGEVLLAGMGEEVGMEGVVAVGAGGAGGRALEEVRERLAVVEEEGEPLPAAAEDPAEESLGGEGEVKGGALVPGMGKGCDEGAAGFVVGLAMDILGEGSVGEHAHAELDPAAAGEAESAEGLGVEELVGDDDGAGRDVERVAQPPDLEGGEAVGDALERRGAGFGAELDEDMVAGVAEDAPGGLGDELAEDGPEGGGGGEVGGAAPAHPVAGGGVVAGPGMEEDDLDEGVEAEDAAAGGPAAELGDKGVPGLGHDRKAVGTGGRGEPEARRRRLRPGGAAASLGGVILAVESSCDESALALLAPDRGLVLERVSSQVELHRPHGGVVPDIASREHLAALPFLLREFAPRMAEVRTVAVTRGPGLPPCLSLGVAFARAVALAAGARLAGVNHLRAHVHSPFIALHAEDPARFEEARRDLLPHLAMVVSGGNTLLVELGADLSVRTMARTVDDAAGEALDKGAKLLGMEYPGGARIEALAAGGDPARFPFPRGIPERLDLRMSFSGLKTALRYQLEKMDDADVAAALPDLCAGYQEAVIAQLEAKFLSALGAGAYRSAGLSGGVANNRVLRRRLAAACESRGLPLLIAEPRHCGDNAGMVAFAALADRGLPEDTAVVAEPSLGVEST